MIVADEGVKECPFELEIKKLERENQLILLQRCLQITQEV